jgi:hypothetical protein
MIVVIVEPSLLAVPPIADSESEVEAIIDRLISWSKMVLRGGILRILQMSETTDALATCNCWPSRPNVETLLELYDLKTVYSPFEISRIINTIIERAETVKTAIGFEVTDCCAGTVRPEVSYQSPELERASHNTLATMTAGVLKQTLFLAPACDLGKAPVRFRAEVLQYTASECLKLDIDVPFSVFGSVICANEPESVCETLKAEDIWDRASTALDIHFGVLLRMREIMRASGKKISLDGAPRFVIGSEFWASLLANQAGPRSRFGLNVLEGCARVVLGIPKNSIDPFMMGARSMNSEQRKRDRDGALAFRTHLTKGHEALRLVFWRDRSGVNEFSNVAVHNDLTLCAGRLDNAVDRSW